jgi:endonuclease/exonuclease/phosphatase family metal-dependent hydrolase
MVQFLRKLNLWVVLFTLLAYIAPYISPYQMSFLMFVGVAFPWLLVINLIFVAIWALSRMRYWWFSAATILVGWHLMSTIFGIHFGQKTPVNTEGDASQSFRVMTYNIHGGIKQNTKNQTQARLELSQFIEQKSPDVLCLQEFVLPWGENIDKLMLNDIPFLKTYPYWIRVKGNDLAIFSRFPILDSGSLLNREATNGCTFADVSVHGQKVRFYTLQLHSNIVSDIADDLAKTKDITDDDSWFSVGRMLTRFRRYGMIRARDAETVKKHINESPNPVILCGDFNDIPVSYTYNTLSDGLTDTFQETGQGIGTTYAGHIPALRIDYILTDPRFKPLNCTVQHVHHSDHYPVWSDVSIGH